MAEQTKPAAPKPITRAGVITNPEPPIDPDAPAPVPPLPETLPLQTQEEMAAGAAMLKKNNAPVAGSGDLPKPGHPDGGVPDAKSAPHR